LLYEAHSCVEQNRFNVVTRKQYKLSTVCNMLGIKLLKTGNLVLGKWSEMIRAACGIGAATGNLHSFWIIYEY
jgi:hypothetical protein